MGAIENYKIDIIGNTLDILTAQYNFFESQGREFTFLVNCLLGIIVAINENENSNVTSNFNFNIDHDFINYIPENIRFIDERDLKSKFEQVNILEGSISLNLNVKNKNDLLGKSLKWFLGKVRNAIAHQNIESINHENEWIGVKFHNKGKYWIDFEVEFTKDELKALCIRLAELNNQ
jgi:hypothetical protein